MKNAGSPHPPGDYSEGLGLGILRAGVAVLCVAGLCAVLWRSYAAPGGPCLYCPGALPLFAATLAVAYASIAGLYLVSRPASIGARGVNLLLANATLIVVVVLFELPAAVHWVDYRRVIRPHHEAMFEVRPWMNPQNRLDPDLLHVHQPHSHHFGTSLGDLVLWYGIPGAHPYPYDVRYDRNGFRNSTDLERAAVVLIGDSYVESPMVAEDLLLSSALARRLNVPVANLGQSGYGPQQELVVLQRFGLALEPHLVLWLFFEGNDLEDFNRYNRIRAEWDQHVRSLDAFGSRSFTRSVLLGLASWMPRPRNELWRKRGCQFGRTPSSPTVPLYFAFGDSPHLAAATAFHDMQPVTGITDVLERAARQTEAIGARFVLVYVPIKLRVYQSLVQCDPETDIAHWQLAAQPGYLARWSQDHNVPFVDLTPALRTAAEAGELVYFPDDDHWNARGQAVAADAIVSHFAEARGL